MTLIEKILMVPNVDLDLGRYVAYDFFDKPDGNRLIAQKTAERKMGT